MGEAPEIEIADLTDEQVADDEVEEAPERIDGRRGQPLPWRLANGDWNGRPLTPFTRWGTALSKNAPPKR